MTCFFVRVETFNSSWGIVLSRFCFFAQNGR